MTKKIKLCLFLLFTIFIFLFFYEPYVAADVNDTLFIQNQSASYNYTFYQNAPKKGGIFTISLNLTSESPSLNFTYYYTYAITSITGSNNTNIYKTNVTGILYPGIEVKITHKVNESLCSELPGLAFEFKKSSNKIAELHISISMLVQGTETCPPQVGGSPLDLNFLIPIIFLIGLFIILIILTNKSSKAKKKEFYNDELYPKNK